MMDGYTADFEKRIEGTIREYGMIAPGEGVVIGVSGGADSVCLLRVLTGLRESLSCRLTAVHVEHGLRGEESLQDAAFTEELCRQLGVDFRLVPVDAAGEAARRGMSVEEAGRQLRYEAFARVKEETGASRIATAHHAEDQAETMLLNLARGTGLTGLGGIRPSAGGRIRPLLFVLRGEIEDYLKALGQDFRYDRTNGEDGYARNRIRHQVMPVLRETVNARSVQHFGQAALDAQRADECLERIARERMKDRVFVSTGPDGLPVSAGIPTAMLLGEEELLREYMVRILLKDLRQGKALKDISRFHIRELIRLASMDGGHSLNLPAGLRAIREREDLVLYAGGQACAPKGAADLSGMELTLLKGHESETESSGKPRILTVPGTDISVSFRTLEGSRVPADIPQKMYTKWLAYDTMSDDVCLRTRRRGDYLTVNAQGGRRKLKDYLIDCKVPREQRDSILLAAQGSHILWVVGWRISEAAKVTPESRAVLEISISGDFTGRDPAGKD